MRFVRSGRCREDNIYHVQEVSFCEITWHQVHYEVLLGCDENSIYPFRVAACGGGINVMVLPEKQTLLIFSHPPWGHGIHL